MLGKAEDYIFQKSTRKKTRRIRTELTEAMAADPSIAAEAEAAARRSEEAAETFFRDAPPLRDGDHIAASVGDFVARHSAGKWPPGSPTAAAARLGSIQVFDELILTPDRMLQGVAAPEGLLGWSASPPAAPQCPWSNAACATSTISPPASVGRPPQSTHAYLGLFLSLVTSPACCFELSVANCRYFLKAGYAVIFIHRR